MDDAAFELEIPQCSHCGVSLLTRDQPEAALVVARENEYTVEEVDLAIHAHPTLSEAALEATLAALGQAIHI